MGIKRMKDRNKYTKWQPLSIENGKVIVNSIIDGNEGLVLNLSFPYCDNRKGKTLEVMFDSYVAYRNMDESYRAKTVSETGVFMDSLYIVESSSWVEWLHEESLGFYKDCNIVHYSIITEADCVDILSEFPPIVKWSNLEI
jgi:hypothetical protein